MHHPFDRNQIKWTALMTIMLKSTTTLKTRKQEIKKLEPE